MNFQCCLITTGFVVALGYASATATAQEPVVQEESSSFWRWWDDEESDTMPDDSTDEEDRPWMITSPFANVTWPEIKMPRIALRPPWGDEEGEGGWFTTPLTHARAATRGAIDRTRSAWNSAVDRMKFALPGGEEEMPAQVAEADRSPGFWQRVFGGDELPEEPGSVGELMAREPGSGSTRIQR